MYEILTPYILNGRISKIEITYKLCNFQSIDMNKNNYTYSSITLEITHILQQLLIKPPELLL